MSERPPLAAALHRLEGVLEAARRCLETDPVRASWLLHYPAHYEMDDLLVMAMAMQQAEAVDG